MRVPLRIVCCVEKDHRFSTAQKRRNEKRENHGIVKESHGKNGENHENGKIAETVEGDCE